MLQVGIEVLVFLNMHEYMLHQYFAQLTGISIKQQSFALEQCSGFLDICELKVCTGTVFNNLVQYQTFTLEQFSMFMHNIKDSYWKSFQCSLNAQLSCHWNSVLLNILTVYSINVTGTVFFSIFQKMYSINVTGTVFF